MIDIGADLQRAYDEGYRKGKEDEHRWWSKLCANCDGVIDEPQPSKVLEAYAKGYKDGADAVKGIKNEPQTCSVSGRPYSECADCEYFRCTADEPQKIMEKCYKCKWWNYSYGCSNKKGICEFEPLKDEQSGKE